MKTIWLNLPVKDIKKSKEFFKAIGFKENPRHKNAEHLGSFYIGENNFVLMLFPENTFKGFAQNEISDTQKGTEVSCQPISSTKKSTILGWVVSLVSPSCLSFDLQPTINKRQKIK